jgi:hypothetical protein
LSIHAGRFGADVEAAAAGVGDEASDAGLEFEVLTRGNGTGGLELFMDAEHIAGSLPLDVCGEPPAIGEVFAKVARIALTNALFTACNVVATFDDPPAAGRGWGVGDAGRGLSTDTALAEVFPPVPCGLSNMWMSDPPAEIFTSVPWAVSDTWISGPPAEIRTSVPCEVSDT